MNEIDFVIPWVDGSDPAWRQEFAAARHLAGEDASVARYRDWETLRYWFRGVERFAPWVRCIHFVTWGHLPAWLDTAHPKLHVVNHADFLPAEYRPTFNSNAIMLNLHRIEGLAEQFVAFNDDMFLCRPAAPGHFFRRGLPCDMARLSIPAPEYFTHTILNDRILIAARYKTHEVLRRHPGKWFSPRYGAANLAKTLLLAPWSVLPGLHDHHMPQAYLRSSFERAWQIWGGAGLDATCRRPFRTTEDLSEWLIRYDVLCQGAFSPVSLRDCVLSDLNETTVGRICRTIEQGACRMICINDSASIVEEEAIRRELHAAFERLLPEPSSFERR